MERPMSHLSSSSCSTSSSAGLEMLSWYNTWSWKPGLPSRGSTPTVIAMAMAMSSTAAATRRRDRSEEHTSELQSQSNLVCRLLLENKKRHLLNLNPSIQSMLKHLLFALAADLLIQIATVHFHRAPDALVANHRTDSHHRHTHTSRI